MIGDLAAAHVGALRVFTQLTRSCPLARIWAGVSDTGARGFRVVRPIRKKESDTHYFSELI
jgi:hypothetical protein